MLYVIHQSCLFNMALRFHCSLSGQFMQCISIFSCRHNTQEESTDGIDLSASCSFNLRDRKAWKLAMKGDIQDTFPKITISKPKTIGVLGE